LVPGTATLGTTRLRARMVYTGTLSPCGTSSYGEVEDYLVTIITPPAEDVAVTSTTISSTPHCEGTPISFDVTVFNYGSSDADGEVDLDVDGDNIADLNDSFSALAPLTSTVITFNTTSPIGAGPYTAHSIVTLTSGVDGNPSNDNGSVAYSHLPAHDVALTSSTFSPAGLTTGVPATLNILLTNSGCNIASGDLVVDWFNDGTDISNLTFGPIAIGGTELVAVPYAGWSSTGSYTLAITTTLTSGTDVDPANNNGTKAYAVTPTSGGPDAFGYTWNINPGCTATDITAIGTLVMNASSTLTSGTIDDGYVTVDFSATGFSFPFYGTSYTTMHVSTNGLIAFGAGQTAWTNATIPDAAAPNNFIAVLWDDLEIEATLSSAIYWYYDAVNNKIIIQYDNVPHLSAPVPQDLQVTLYANGGVDILWVDVDETYSVNNVTVGLEDGTGAVGLLYNFNSSGNATMGPVSDGVCVSFALPSCTNPPVGGTAVSTASTVCSSSSSFTLSLTGSSVGTGLTYQWQTSPDDVTWTDVSGATNSTYIATQSATTYYRCNVTCTATTASSSVQVTMGTPTGGTAASTASTVCSGSDSFTLSLTGTSTAPGQTYQWQSSPDNSVWSDISGATSDTYVATQSAMTYYRCNVICGATAPSSSVQVTMGSPIGGTTAASINPVCPNTNFTLSLTGASTGPGQTYQWQSSPDNTAWTDITGATSDTYVAQQTTATYYRCNVTCGTTVASASIYETMETIASNCYCTPTYTYLCSSGDFINNFTLETISNLASGCNGNADNYILYPSGTYTATLTPGNSYPISMQSGSWGQGFGVWIDFNQNGSFEDSGELVYASPTSGTGLYSGTIAIPGTATAGQTRMRVRCKYAGTIVLTESCSNFSYGETEDYFVTIGSACPTPQDPVAISSVQQSGSDVVLIWNASTGATSYKVYWDTVPGGTTYSMDVGNVLTWTDVGAASLANRFYTVTANCSVAPVASPSGKGTASVSATTNNGKLTKAQIQALIDEVNSKNITREQKEARIKAILENN
ncbi:hypothetical protein IT568_09815, partial [bacterium]|nr:hypothetical protein [bacterium]